MLDLEELGWLALKQAAGERAASLNQQAVLPCEHDERHRQVLHMLKVGWGGEGAGGGRRLCCRACMMVVHTRYVCICVLCGGVLHADVKSNPWRSSTLLLSLLPLPPPPS